MDEHYREEAESERQERRRKVKEWLEINKLQRLCYKGLDPGFQS